MGTLPRRPGAGPGGRRPPSPGKRRRVGHRSGGAPVRTGPAAPPQTRWGGRVPGGPGADAEGDEAGELAAGCRGIRGIHGIHGFHHLVHTLTDDTACPALDGAA